MYFWYQLISIQIHLLLIFSLPCTGTILKQIFYKSRAVWGKEKKKTNLDLLPDSTLLFGYY